MYGGCGSKRISFPGVGELQEEKKEDSEEKSKTVDFNGEVHCFYVRTRCRDMEDVQI